MRSNAQATFITAARRGQLVRSAIEALSATGYAGTSLAAIASRAGVSKGVLLYHFKDKDDLMGSVLMDVYSRAGERIGAAIARHDNSRAEVMAYVEENLAFLAEHPHDIRAIVEIAANARREDGSPRFGSPGQDPVLDHLVEILDSGRRSGQLGTFDPRALAILIRGAIDTASGRLVNDERFDLAAYGTQLLAVIDCALGSGDKELP